MLAGFEGYRERAYQDIVGVWTVGYGETYVLGRKVREGDVLPKPAALSRLRTRCDVDYGPSVLEAVAPYEPTQSQYDAMVSLAYNIGTAGFAKSTVARKLREGDVKGASAAFLMWNKAGGKVRLGLTRRREVERTCFDAGEYPKTGAR